APPPPPPAEATPALAAEPDEPPALDLESDLRARPLRPAAPAAPPATERRGVLRYVLVGMAMALVLGGIGYAAYVLRDRPEEIARARPESAAPAPAGESSGKIVERIGGGGAPAPAAESTPIPTVRAPTTAIRPPGATPAPAAAPQTAPPAAAAPGVAVAQRSALLIENKQGGQPDVFVGTTVWRADQGVLRAEIDIPEAKLKASMAMRKNADLTLAASHTMELRIDAPAGDLAIGKVGAPELRREDMANGDRLAAVAVPIAAGYWLVGLARGERDVQYNLDLMRGRGWFDIPIQLADGRIAKLTFEKGAPGERALADASAAW
ncbi:MAG: hypothetical protein JNK46_09665, partial [Methylobacteriaceae bacterium]|nr:hypothetical protein [Methylobacteriaceae bacterium]